MKRKWERTSDRRRKKEEGITRGLRVQGRGDCEGGEAKDSHERHVGVFYLLYTRTAPSKEAED